MTALIHLHPLHPRTAWPRLTAASRERAVDHRVLRVHRLGAVLVGLFLLVFGLLGRLSGVALFATHGQRFLGLAANGLLATVSILVGAVLVGAALRSPRTASTAMLLLGPLFLVSALVNLAVLETSLNLFALEMADVVFSVVVGVLLLVLGAYGRITGNLPADSPYARARTEGYEPAGLPTTAEEVAAEAAMRAAEIAVVEHRATDDQRRRVQAMATVRTRADRRSTWMAFDRPALPEDDRFAVRP